MSKKKQQQNEGKSEHVLLQGCHLATAILQNDADLFTKVLVPCLPPGVASVTDVTIQKSAGEAFTGGRSTPVYSITAQVHRNDQSRERHFIVKLVLMMDDIDDDDDESSASTKIIQLRESYAVERRFYDIVGPEIRDFLNVPKLLHSDLDGSKAWPVFCILMNDMTVNFPEHPLFLPVCNARSALKWLATFHAFYWGTKQSQSKNWRLWNRGGFWTKTNGESSRVGANWTQTIRFIETKHKDVMPAHENLNSFGKRLQNAGKSIHDFLNKLSASQRYGTVIHGDYKAANMFFTSASADTNEREEFGSSNVAVVDFQFTGFGVCSDDVAYLLYPDARGSFSDAELEDLLECYHTHLVEQLMVHGRGGPSTLSHETLLILFRLSQLEMTRHWIQRGWAASTVAEVNLLVQLDSFMSEYLDSGKVLSRYDDKLVELLPIL